MAAVAEVLPGGWRARLHLGFRRGPGKTLLADRSREGPLTVQRAFYPEGDLCHVYLLHPPGGVAGGDSLKIAGRVGPGAAALVTTPGATKFYRSLGAVACQRQHLNVSGGSLEWLPQENILFPGARAELSTIVHLADGARFIGAEINCLGRPVVGERFDTGRAVFGFSLVRDGCPILHERMTVHGGRNLRAAAGLRGLPVLGSFYATTDDPKLVDMARDAVPEANRGELGVSLVDGLLVARYLGASTETAKRLFTTLWKTLRFPVLNRLPCEPRIWNT